MTVTGIQKGFVHIAGSKLHYAVSGSGPLVVLLHASPNSAKTVRPLQQLWGQSLTCLAFDLPGYGLSDPVEGEITTAKVADRLAEGLRALGVGRAALYGRHTGAGVAVELSILHPDLVSFVLTDGFPLFDKAYDGQALSEYFRIPVPERDGGHLIWAYYRCREQYLFWPWNKPGLTTRADRGVPDHQYLHRSTVEFLEAGADLPGIYASAFKYDGRGALSRLTVPTCFGNRPGDSQFKTMPTYPQNLWTRQFDRDHVVAAVQEREVLLDNVDTGDAELTLPSGRPGNSVRCDYVDTRHGQSFVVQKGMSLDARPLMLVPPLPGSHADLAEALEFHGQNRPCVTFDPYGFGESEWQDELSVRLWAEQVVDIASALGWTTWDVQFHGTSCLLTVDVLKLAGGSADVINWQSPAIPPPETRRQFATVYGLDISPSSEGAHLLRLWHFLRDQQLFFPWYDRSHAARRVAEPRIAPEYLQRLALPLLKQPQSFARAYDSIWSYPGFETLAAANLGKRVNLLVDPSDTFAPLISHAEQVLGTKAQAVAHSAETIPHH